MLKFRVKTLGEWILLVVALSMFATGGLFIHLWTQMPGTDKNLLGLSALAFVTGIAGLVASGAVDYQKKD